MNVPILIPTVGLGKEKINYIPGDSDVITAGDLISSYGPEYGYDIIYSSRLDKKEYDQLNFFYLTGGLSSSSQVVTSLLRSKGKDFGFQGLHNSINILSKDVIRNYVFEIREDAYKDIGRMIQVAATRDDLKRNQQEIQFCPIGSINRINDVNSSSSRYVVSSNNSELFESCVNIPMRSVLSRRIKGKSFFIRDLKAGKPHKINLINDINDNAFKVGSTHSGFEISVPDILIEVTKLDDGKSFGLEDLLKQVSRSKFEIRIFLNYLWNSGFFDNLQVGLYNLFSVYEYPEKITKKVDNFAIKDSVIGSDFSIIDNLLRRIENLGSKYSNRQVSGDNLYKWDNNFKLMFNSTIKGSKYISGVKYPAYKGGENGFRNDSYSRLALGMFMNKLFINRPGAEFGKVDIINKTNDSIIDMFNYYYNNNLPKGFAIYTKFLTAFCVHYSLGIEFEGLSDKSYVDAIISKYGPSFDRLIELYKGLFSFSSHDSWVTTSYKVDKIFRSDIHSNLDPIIQKEIPYAAQIKFTFIKRRKGRRYNGSSLEDFDIVEESNMYGYVMFGNFKEYINGNLLLDFVPNEAFIPTSDPVTVTVNRTSPKIFPYDLEKVAFTGLISRSVILTTTRKLFNSNFFKVVGKNRAFEINVDDLVKILSKDQSSSISNKLIWKEIFPWFRDEETKIDYEVNSFSKVLLPEIVSAGRDLIFTMSVNYDNSFINTLNNIRESMDYTNPRIITSDYTIDKNKGLFIAVDKQRVDFKKVLKNNKEVNFDRSLRNLARIKDNNLRYYSLYIRKRDIKKLRNIDNVEINIDELIDDIDLINEGSNLAEILVAHVNSDLIESGEFSVTDPAFISGSTKLLNYDPFSDDFMEYVNSEEFKQSFVVNGKSIIDVDDFIRFINIRDNAINIKVIEAASDMIKASSDEIGKIIRGANSILSLNNKEDGQAPKGQEIAQITDSFNKINEGIEKLSMNDINDSFADSIMKNRLSSRIATFDLSLSDPNIILSDWKFRMMNNFIDYQLKEDGSDSVKSFNHLIENLSIPFPDFSKVSRIMALILDGAKKIVDATVRAAAKALAIYDNIYNIINIVRFPMKIKKPVLSFNPKRRRYDMFLVLPNDISLNPNVLNNYLYDLDSPFILNGEDNRNKLYNSLIFIPELKYKTRCIIVSISDNNLDEFLKFYNQIQSDDSLSELSKFISIITWRRHKIFMNLSASDEAWMSSIIAIQATLAAGTAFASAKDPIGGGISAAVSAAAVIGTNIAAAHDIKSYNTGSFNDWFVYLENNDFSEFIDVIISSVRNVSALPMTPVYIAGSVMIEVVKILGAFAISAVLGAAVGHVTRKFSNYIKTRKKRKELLANKKVLTNQMNSELKEVNKEEISKIKPDDVTSKEWKKISVKTAKEKKKQIRLKYSSMDGGVINMNRVQMKGLADYNLFLADNGILNSGLANKTIEVVKNNVKGLGAAGIAASAAVGSMANSTVQSLIKKVKNRDKDDEKALGNLPVYGL